MSRKQEFYNRLPDRFTRDDALKVGRELEYSYSAASAMPSKLVYEGKADRTGYGEYQKVGDDV